MYGSGTGWFAAAFGAGRTARPPPTEDARMSLLDSLKSMTTVVADTGDIEAMAAYKPQDATTNPSLLYKAAQQEQYRALVDDALAHAAQHSGAEAERAQAFQDKLFVNFGREILEIVPGRVSTEVAARDSFNTAATIDKAHTLIRLYETAGVPRERVLIKIAATWEGIRAAEQLEKEGIHCNLTLLFSFAQAVACAEAKVTLISPFVGRIYDYHKKAQGVADIPLEEDPGVASVERIYTYFKKYDHQTQVMGASFRKAGQIIELAGCDLLTISPKLLQELQDGAGELTRRLSVDAAKASDVEEIHLDESAFRWMHNQDPMAVDKLSDGIRLFHADGRKLEEFARSRVAEGAPS